MFIFPAWHLVIYTVNNILQIFPSPKISLRIFCFRLERPTGSVDRILCPGRARSYTSVGRPIGRPPENICSLFFCRSPDRSTDQKLLLSVFCRSADRSTAFTKLCFLFEAGQPVGRPETNGYMPARLTADRTSRPPSLPAANGSFLFGENLKSVLGLFLWQTFSGFCGLFSDQISLK